MVHRICEALRSALRAFVDVGVNEQLGFADCT